VTSATSGLDRDGFDVAAWWGCVQHGCQGRRAITTSHDGFATAAYEKWNLRLWESHSPAPSPWTVPAFADLAQETVWSMEDSAEGVQVVIAGGDGTTHRPFQKVGRSADHGETWEVYDAAPIDGEVAYHYGAVGLPDGRLNAVTFLEIRARQTPSHCRQFGAARSAVSVGWLRMTTNCRRYEPSRWCSLSQVLARRGEA